jgi:hypothetical protein
MNPTHRSAAAALALALSAALPFAALAQDFPTRPVRVYPILHAYFTQPAPAYVGSPAH